LKGAVGFSGRGSQPEAEHCVIVARSLQCDLTARPLPTYCVEELARSKQTIQREEQRRRSNERIIWSEAARDPFAQFIQVPGLRFNAFGPSHLVILRKFCTAAAIRNSDRAPFKPRRRNRSIFMMHLFAQPPLRLDFKAITNDQHADHLLGIDRRATGLAVEAGEMLPQLIQVNDAVDDAQQVILGP